MEKVRKKLSFDAETFERLEEIARETNRSESAVVTDLIWQYRFATDGIVDPERKPHIAGRPRKLTEKEIDDLVDAYNNGATQNEVAEEFGVSRNAVKRYLKSRRATTYE